MLPQALHEMCIEYGGDAPLAVMSPQENAEQIGRILKQLRDEVKDISEYEIFGVIIPQCLRVMASKSLRSSAATTASLRALHLSCLVVRKP